MPVDQLNRVVEEPPEWSLEWVEGRLIHAASVYRDSKARSLESSLCQFDMVRDSFVDMPDEYKEHRTWSPRDISLANETQGWLSHIYPSDLRKLVSVTIFVKTFAVYGMWDRVKALLRTSRSKSTLRRHYRAGMQMLVAHLLEDRKYSQ